jgi:hypothetical protein
MSKQEVIKKELVNLTYCRSTQTSNNLSKWKEVAYSTVAEKYGAIAVVINKREYPESRAETIKDALIQNYDESKDPLDKILIQTKYKQV